TAMGALRGLDLDNALVQSVAGETAAAFAASGALAPVLSGTSSTTDALFGAQPSVLGRQLLQVSRIIEARSVLGASRQIFFVALGGVDTPNDQLNPQSTPLAAVPAPPPAVPPPAVALGGAAPGATFHSLRLRPDAGPCLGRRLRPCLGQPPAGARGRGAGPADLRDLPHARARWSGRLHRPGPLASHDLDGSVRGDARPLVRGGSGRPRV